MATISNANSKEKNIKKGNKITLIVLTISINYMIGSSLDSFTPLSVFFVDFNSSIKRYITVVGNTLLFISHGISFFIFFIFDKSYSNKLFSLLNNCIKFKKI